MGLNNRDIIFFEGAFASFTVVAIYTLIQIGFTTLTCLFISMASLIGIFIVYNYILELKSTEEWEKEIR